VAIAEGCPLLEEINLSCCHQLTDISINALAHCCRRLTCVTLQHCEGVLNRTIQNLIRRARQLQVLDVMYNEQLTFASMAELPLYCFCMRNVYLYDSPCKPVMLEFEASYRSYRHYVDVVFGWSEELRANYLS